MYIDRIGSGLFAMAMLVWLLWPAKEWRLEAEPAVAFVVALVVWIWREYSAHKSDQKEKSENEPHPHDVALARRIRSTFCSRTKTFLRNHDFGATFSSEKVSPIFMVADQWRGVDYEFQDKDLDDAMVELIRLTRNLAERLAIDSGPVGNNAKLHSVPRDEERARDLFSEETTKNVAEINELTTEVLEAAEKLERQMREKVPSVYTTQS